MRPWNGYPAKCGIPSLSRAVRKYVCRGTRLPHHGRGLAEQDPALFLGAVDRLAEIRIDLFRLGVGAPRGRALAGGFGPAPELRDIADTLPLGLAGNHPGITHHVGDRILASDEFAIGQALVEHAIETVGLVYIAIDGVLQLLHRVVAEVMVLPRHRPEVAHLPEGPLDHVIAAVEIGGNELVGLLGELKQDGGELEARYPLAAACGL